MAVQHDSKPTPHTDDALALLRMLNELPRAPRTRRAANADESLALLQQLLAAPPDPYDGLLPPPTLRSIDVQRRNTLGRYSLNTQFDTLLYRSAQLLTVASILSLGYWFVDGPLHDWLYKRQQTQSILAARSLAPFAAGSRANVSSANAASRAGIAGRAQPAPNEDFLPPYQGGPVATPLPANVSRLPSATPLPANANQSPATSFAEDEPLDTRQDMLAIAAHTNTTTAPANEDDFLAPQRPTLALSAPQDDLPAPQQPPSPPEGADRRPTRLLIPSIAVDTPVKEVLVVGDTWEVAEYAAGYMEGTNVPGDYGNVGISGHLGLYGGVFANLSSLAIGGDVYVDAAGWRYHYRVRDRKVIWPTEVEILDPTLEPTLTLLTCTNWDTQRLAVIADLIASQPI